MNLGNSGGPLVNIYGDIIGINSAIYASDEANPGFQGIGFTIPSNEVYASMIAMQNNKPLVRGYLGVSISSLDPDPKHNHGYTKDQGVIVNSVTPGTPAATSGLQEGDIITHYENKPVVRDQHFVQLVRRTNAGSTIEMKIWRKGEALTLTATLLKSPDELLRNVKSALSQNQQQNPLLRRDHCNLSQQL